MTSEEYKKAMECLEPDPLFRARAAAAAETGGRPRRRPLRMAVIAAAACLALVGTAFAVTEWADLNVRIYKTSPFINKDGHSVEFAVDFYPLDSFNQELIAMGAAEDLSQQYKYFDTWDEMQAFAGVEVVHNPVLDSAEPGLLVGNPWNRDWTTHLLFLPVFTEDGEPQIIQAIGNYLVDGIQVRIFEVIYTERAEGTLYYDSKGYPTTAEGYRHTDGHYERALGDGRHARLGMEYDKGCEVSQETYTTPNGLDVLIIQARQPDSKKTILGAYFLSDGVLFQVVTWGKGIDGEPTEPEHAMEVLKTVLDGFVLE